jgi:hypothetical protein
MTLAEWRALLEAYLDRRLSAEAFARRFLEAWNQARAAGAAMPGPIADIFSLVEQFDSDAQGRDQGETDDRNLAKAARQALSRLEEAPTPSGARTYDRARARDDLRRFQIHMSGCAGIGCAVALIWVGLCLLQIFAVSDQIQAYLQWPAAPATFAGLFLAFVPVIGNLIAFFGAVDVWGWDKWLAAIVFFAAPAATMLSGWSRWRRYRR